jgi:hypothetical protein
VADLMTAVISAESIHKAIETGVDTPASAVIAGSRPRSGRPHASLGIAGRFAAFVELIVNSIEGYCNFAVLRPLAQRKGEGSTPMLQIDFT